MRKIFVVFISFLFLNTLWGQQPDTTCVNADVFCDQASLENSVWTLPEPFEPALPDRLCDATNGQPNNMLYFGFVPNASTVTIQINPSNCTATNGNSIGYQWGIMEGCNLEDPVFIICDGNPLINMTVATYDSFQPGTTYFLYLDGYEGCICDFTLNILTGIADASNPFTVDEPGYFSSSTGDTWAIGDTIDFCKDGYFTTTVHGVTNGQSFLWSSPKSDGSGDLYLPSDTDTLEMTFSVADSLYKICTQALTDCDDSEQACFYVNVEAVPDDSLGVFAYCMADITLGVFPPGWEGDTLYLPGTHFLTITDSILGCTHDQSVTIEAKLISIESLDTVLCGPDTLFYNGDTITANVFEKQYRFEGGSANGCDSLLNLRVDRFDFSGVLSNLKCLNNNNFGIEIELNSIIPADYDSLVVVWFLNNSYLKTGSTNNLQLLLAEKGTYGAMITVYRDGEPCSFDLNEVEIDRFISADFITSLDSICVDDTLVVTLQEFNIAATYEWMNADEVIEVFPGNYQIIWNTPGVHTLNLQLNYESCKVNAAQDIFVEAKLEKPEIFCSVATNDSIYIEWNSVECATEYEVWMDGAYISTITGLDYSFTGLNQDQSYQFEIVAISDCLCPNSNAIINCKTYACDQNIAVFIDQLPLELCSEDFLTDTLLSGFVTGSTGGSFSWSGDIISSDGWIIAEGLLEGSYAITLQYQIDFCSYEFTDTFVLHGPIEMDIDKYDISCYDSNDGSINIAPMQGDAPFTLFINGETAAMETQDLAKGIYDIELIDVNNCSLTRQLEITRPEKPQLLINGTTIIERGETHTYEMTIADIQYDSIVWFVPLLDTILCAGQCDNISYAPFVDQELCVELFYNDVCSVDTCLSLLVNTDLDVYIPNAFTPGNNDGLNDYFMFKTNAYSNLTLNKFSIFDRWGEMVFHKENREITNQTPDSFGWNGRYQGKLVLPGVYIYLIELVDVKGNVYRYYGDITLIR